MTPTTHSQPFSQHDPDSAKEHWLSVGRWMIEQSIPSAESSARQVIIVAGVLEGLIFRAVTFSEIGSGDLSLPQLLAYLTPVTLLFISLTASLLVLSRGAFSLDFNDPEACQRLHSYLAARKHRYLRVAFLFLLLGVASIFVAVLVYLVSGEGSRLDECLEAGFESGLFDALP